ncbi:MAG: YybH family protein [Acidiferrobacterales bacterium]
MDVPMPREPETFEQAMTTLNADITEAFNRGDVKACAGFYMADATMLLPDRPPIKGREAIEALLNEYAAVGTKVASIDPIEVSSSGGLGYCVGTYQFDTPAEDGSTKKETGKFVSVFELQADGSWKAVIDSLIRDTATGS